SHARRANHQCGGLGEGPVRSLPLLIALLGAILTGCSRPSQTAPTATAQPAASYKYEVRGANGACQRGEAEAFTVTAGQNTVSVQNGRLVVNGNGYGLLRDGDSIAVDESGKVTVNGALQSPE